jgi:hypothetical protein
MSRLLRALRAAYKAFLSEWSQKRPLDKLRAPEFKGRKFR